MGTKHSTLYSQILSLAKTWGVQCLVIDATGVGAGLAGFLDKALPGKVVPFTFTTATKSRLGWNFLSVIETGRWKDWRENDPEREEFITQLKFCQMGSSPARIGTCAGEFRMARAAGIWVISTLTGL